MTRPLFGHDTTVAEWVGDRLGHVFPPPYTAIGFLSDDGTLIGGAVFTQCNGFNSTVSIYGPGALERSSIRAVMQYVFVQLKCTRLTALTRRSNYSMRAALPRLGFKQEGIMRRYFGRSKADDALVYGLLRINAETWIADRGQFITSRRAERTKDRRRAG